MLVEVLGARLGVYFGYSLGNDAIAIEEKIDDLRYAEANSWGEYMTV